MNKKEMMEKADELIKKANELKELANGQDYILVPDQINITKSMEWFWMWIINWNHELYFFYKNKTWAVNTWINQLKGEDILKWKLTPCKYEDLDPWDLLYRWDNDNPVFDSLRQYWIKLSDWSYQFWGNKHCLNGDETWQYYWKVEPI